jgi:predicted aspartyl protease
MSKYSDRLNDSIVSDLLAIKIRNYIRLSQYREVTNTCQQLLEQYSSVLDSAKMTDYKNTQSMYEKIVDVKPLRIHKQGDVEISSYRNPFLNLVMTPVKSGGVNADFMFDTGSDMSVITNTYAEKMGLTIYETDTRVETSTSSVQAKIAVADSLYIGDILFENVVFLVMPLFSIAELNLYVHGIIGAQEMRQMGEIHIRKDGSIFIPEVLENKKTHNLYLGGLEGLSPIVQLQSENDTLMFTFDTGANATNLSKRFYDNHSEEVQRNGILKSVSINGVGGTEQNKTYTLKNYPYIIGTKSNMLSEVDVEFTDDEYDGNIGEDMIIPFNKMILNFRYMYVDFE